MTIEWSKKEKKIARKAFDLAYSRTIENFIKYVNSASISKEEELWEFCDELKEKQKEIGRMFDFRYSVLPMAFSQFVSKGVLNPKELEGLAEDKLSVIKQFNNDL